MTMAPAAEETFFSPEAKEDHALPFLESRSAIESKPQIFEISSSNNSQINDVLMTNVTSRPFPLPPPGFHPDFLFCGECTDCKLKPSSHEALTYGDATAGIISDTKDTNSPAARHIRIRVSTPVTFSGPSLSPLILHSMLQPLPGVLRVYVITKETDSKNEMLVSADYDAQCQPERLLLVLKQAGYTAEKIIDGTESINDTDYKDHVLSDDINRVSPQSDSSAVSAINVVRSVFAVQGICCASEVPSVRKILKSLTGVFRIQINVTTKRVYVQHNPRTISASDIAARLTLQGFAAKIMENGAKTKTEALAGFTTTFLNKDGTVSNKSTTVGRSTFHTHAVLHPQDIPKIKLQLVSLPGIQRIGVNVAECVLIVEHDVNLVSANELQEHLQPNYIVTLIQDGQSIQQQQATAFLDDQLRSKYVESTLMIANLTRVHVPNLIKAIKQNFIRTHIRAVLPHTVSHTVKIEHNPDYCSAPLICETLSSYGLDAHVVTDGAINKLYLPLVLEGDDDENDDMDGHGAQKQASHLRTGAQTYDDWQQQSLKRHVVLSGIFWLISMFSAIGGNFAYLRYAGLVSVLFGLPPVARKAWRTLRRCEFDANCMMVTAAIGAILLQEFDEAASVSFLFAVSEYLEMRATDRARSALSEILQLRPDHANVVHPNTKELVVVPANKVPVGSLISVRMGDRIVADGFVVEGTSSVDESSLTGESFPVRKTMGSVVSGGTINIGSTQLIIRTTCSVEESAVSRLIRLVEEAQINRSPTEKMIDGFARAYTPVVVTCAAIMATIPWLFGKDIGRHWTLNALIIIVIACPCALTISTPVTYAAGLAAMAQRGIVVKDGASLEALGSVDKVIFDKTGTLTEGNFAVKHIEEVGDLRSRAEMLALLALMESPSSHPLSATLVKAAQREGVCIPKNVEIKNHSILKGEGIEATVDGKQVYVGNCRLFERLSMYENLPQAYQGLAMEWMTEGCTVVFIGVEGEGIIGVFSMIDKIRPEAKDVVSSLQFGGFDVMILTGDGEGAARAVAEQLGLPETAVQSELMPEDKLHFVGSLKRPAPKHSFGLFRRQRKVLFCGDGVNDAPAIAVADVGVSMGEGAALAMEMSDVTFMDSNLHKLIYVIKMGTRVMFTVQENIIISLICKVLVVALTFGGQMTLLYAIASDVGVMLLVTLNGMKLLPGHTEALTLPKARQRSADNKLYNELPLTGLESSPTSVAEIV